MAVLLLAALLLPAGVVRAQTTQTHELPGKEVSVYNLIGEVRVVAGTGPAVRVDVTMGGEDWQELRIEKGEFNGRQTLRVIYPGGRFVYKAMGRGSTTQLHMRDDGTFGNTEDSRRVRISGSGEGLEAHADLTIHVPEGITLAVKQAVGEVSARDVNAKLNLDVSSAPVSASGIKGALSIDVGSGEVDVTKIEGTLIIDTGSGDVTMADVRSPSVDVDTGSGRVRGRGIVAESIDIDTGSGGISVEGVDARTISLDTGSGGVEIDLASDIELLDIDTGSGGVYIGVPPTLGAEVRLETGSGGIDIDVDHESYRYRHSEFSGRIGDGKGEIDVDTGSGGVRLARAGAR